LAVKLFEPTRRFPLERLWVCFERGANRHVTKCVFTASFASGEMRPDGDGCAR
jgi:hypothetical protein